MACFIICALRATWAQVHTQRRRMVCSFSIPFVVCAMADTFTVRRAGRDGISAALALCEEVDTTSWPSSAAWSRYLDGRSPGLLRVPRQDLLREFGCGGVRFGCRVRSTGRRTREDPIRVIQEEIWMVVAQESPPALWDYFSCSSSPCCGLEVTCPSSPCSFGGHVSKLSVLRLEVTCPSSPCCGWMSRVRAPLVAVEVTSTSVCLRVGDQSGRGGGEARRQCGRDVHLESVELADAALQPGLRVRVAKAGQKTDRRGVGCGGRTAPHQAERGAAAPLRGAKASSLWHHRHPPHRVRRDLRAGWMPLVVIIETLGKGVQELQALRELPGSKDGEDLIRVIQEDTWKAVAQESPPALWDNFASHTMGMESSGRVGPSTPKDLPPSVAFTRHRRSVFAKSSVLHVVTCMFLRGIQSRHKIGSD